VVTVSIGVAVAAADTGSGGVGTVMDCADRALLTAKSGGRNRVTIGRSAA
jgi:PleD family two-component response regulator